MRLANLYYQMLDDLADKIAFNANHKLTVWLEHELVETTAPRSVIRTYTHSGRTLLVVEGKTDEMHDIIQAVEQTAMKKTP